jgi:hypothetical protein
MRGSPKAKPDCLKGVAARGERQLALHADKFFSSIGFWNHVQRNLCAGQSPYQFTPTTTFIVMDTELGRIVISALSTLSGMVVAYRARSESSKVLADQEVASVTPSSTDPWRWRADTVLISAEELDQIVSKAEASPESGTALASIVPEQVLREVLEHVDAEIARLQESIADTSRSKARRHRDLDHAEAEVCVELKTIKRHNNNVIPDVPQRALARLWQQHRCQ